MGPLDVCIGPTGTVGVSSRCDIRPTCDLPGWGDVSEVVPSRNASSIVIPHSGSLDSKLSVKKKAGPPRTRTRPHNRPISGPGTFEPDGGEKSRGHTSGLFLSNRPSGVSNFTAGSGLAPGCHPLQVTAGGEDG